MAYNLSRNSRVFVTTNLSTASGQTVVNAGTSKGPGEVLNTGFALNNTWEVQVLDGFKFSQGTNQATITINEASAAPVRGQRSFNTALNPVDISFSTYIRPRLASSQSTAEERVLWNALMGSVGIEGTLQNAATVASVTVSAGTVTGTATRTSTTASTVTVSGTLTLSTAPSVGDVYTIKGVTGVGAAMWNQPMRVVSYTAGTQLVFDYLSAPPASAGVNSGTALFNASIKLDKAAWVENPTATGVTTSYSQLTSAQSNKNQLQAVGFIFVVDNSVYTVDNCAIDGAQIDFGLDAIATIAWTAKGTKLTQVTSAVVVTDANAGLETATVTMTGGLTTSSGFKGKMTGANYITNKLSTVTLQSQLYGRSEVSASTAYTVVLTGGSIQIANNINYVTPNNIGVVNIPYGYYTGARSVSGTLNAYLKTGTGQTADLLSSLLSNISSAAETKFRCQIEIGGASSGTKVEMEMPGCLLGIPSVDVADVISTAITFNAQGTDEGVTNTYDIENTNDLAVRYYSL